MRNKVIWGLGILIVLLIGTSVLVMVNEHTENQQLEDDEMKAQKRAEPINQQKKLKNNPSVAREGLKMVQHDDRSHELPIDSPDTVQEEQIADTSDDTQQPVVEADYPNPENPVKALREYLEKRGHWSAEYIPDFPPEDTEAARMAQNVLIMIAHRDAGNKFYDGPAEPANREFRQTLEHYKHSMDQRSWDMYKLSWAVLDKPFSSVFFEVLPQIKKRK